MKDKGTAAVLALFFGGIGVHRFYVGQIGLGIFYFIFCWTFIPALFGVLDCIFWCIRTDESFNKEYNKSFLQQQDFMNQQLENTKNINATLANTNKVDVANQIEKLHELMTKGIITEAEFQKKKAELL